MARRIATERDCVYQDQSLKPPPGYTHPKTKVNPRIPSAEAATGDSPDYKPSEKG